MMLGAWSTLLLASCCPAPWPEPKIAGRCAYNRDRGKCHQFRICALACGGCSLCDVHGEPVRRLYTRLWKYSTNKPPAYYHAIAHNQTTADITSPRSEGETLMNATPAGGRRGRWTGHRAQHWKQVPARNCYAGHGASFNFRQVVWAPETRGVVGKCLAKCAAHKTCTAVVIEVRSSAPTVRSRACHLRAGVSVQQCQRDRRFDVYVAQGGRAALSMIPARQARSRKHARLPRRSQQQHSLASWMGLLQGMSGRTTCYNQTSLGTQDAKRKGNDWELCLDGWRPTPGCLALSVGVGNAWEFDDAMGRLGCEVHSFDPTFELRVAHMLHQAPRVHFHYVGLGKMEANKYGRAGSDEEERAEMVALDEMLERWAGTRRSVDVLKIDCEGCEWDALLHLVTRAPSLLRRVRLLLLELHVGMGRAEAAAIGAIAEHLFIRHGFRVYRQRTNLGKLGDRFKAKRALRSAGLHPEPCCYELHLMRPATGDPGILADVSKETWYANAVQETVARLRKDDWSNLVAYDRRHGTAHTTKLAQLRAIHDNSTAAPFRYPQPTSDMVTARHALPHPESGITSGQQGVSTAANEKQKPCCPRINLEGTRVTSKALCRRKARTGGCPDAACPVACGMCVLCPGHPQIETYRRLYYNAHVTYHAKYTGIDPVQYKDEQDQKEKLRRDQSSCNGKNCVI